MRWNIVSLWKENLAVLSDLMKLSITKMVINKIID